MEVWTVIRFLHVVALAFFIGGQLALVVAVTPVVRRQSGEETMRIVARRFGAATALALLVLIATGVAMAGHFGRWDDPTLHAKLAVLALVGVLLGLHIAAPTSRTVSYSVLIASLFVTWLGVELAHG